jgi:hypothetical protein
MTESDLSAIPALVNSSISRRCEVKKRSQGTVNGSDPRPRAEVASDALPFALPGNTPQQLDARAISHEKKDLRVHRTILPSYEHIDVPLSRTLQPRFGNHDNILTTDERTHPLLLDLPLPRYQLAAHEYSNTSQLPIDDEKLALERCKRRESVLAPSKPATQRLRALSDVTPEDTDMYSVCQGTCSSLHRLRAWLAKHVYKRHAPFKPDCHHCCEMSQSRTVKVLVFSKNAKIVSGANAGNTNERTMNFRWGIMRGGSGGDGKFAFHCESRSSRPLSKRRMLKLSRVGLRDSSIADAPANYTL